MQEIKVKPCPFCGQQPHITSTKPYKHTTPLRWGMVCRGCAICLGWSETAAEAVERWNTRPGERTDDPSHPFADVVMMGE